MKTGTKSTGTLEQGPPQENGAGKEAEPPKKKRATTLRRQATQLVPDNPYNDEALFQAPPKHEDIHERRMAYHIPSVSS